MTPQAKQFLTVLAGFGLGLSALAASAQTTTALGNVPLFFEANSGQAGSPARFLARGSDAQFLIAPTEAQFVLRKSAGEIATVRMQFIGANAQAQISGDAELPGKINYLTGNNPAQWRSGIPTFAKVRVAEIYPGVGLIYYGNRRQLEYDFDITPGANPNAVAIHFDGVEKISVNVRGELDLELNGGEILQPKPVIYQMAGGERKKISGGYKILDARTVGFAIGNYDSSLPLVIDPILSYSTYFGGTLGETAWAVAVNTNDGSVYIAGQTFSKQFYTNGPPSSTPGAYQTNFQGGALTGDAFVARFDSPGTNLMYLTYLGGSADDAAFGVAVDGSGDAYVCGFTDSTNFPVTNSIPGGIPGLKNSTNISGAFSKSYGFYPGDAFVAELNPGGSNLIYSTYLGGSSVDSANSIAVDAAGDAYVTGLTYSTNFPVTNAVQSHFAFTNSAYFNNANAFVTEIASNGSGIVFSTYLGGTNFDEGEGIAVDASNFIYVTGFTDSTNFPNTNSFQKYLNGSTNVDSGISPYSLGSDAFVTKYFPTGSNYVYSTYLGGTNSDFAYSIACDTSGNAYVAGLSTSPNFPNTATNVPGLYSFVATNNQFLTTNAFLTKITNGVGTTAGIAYSAFFGGYVNDTAYGVAVDPAGNAFVVGTTFSTNFPVYNNLGLLSGTNSGGSDVFVTAFNTNASALLYSTYLGGYNNDSGYGIAVDANDNAYIVGETSSTNFPTTTLSTNLPIYTNFPIYNAQWPHLNGTNDTFLAIISPGQFHLSLSITPAPTNKVTLTWPEFPEFEPDLSAYKLESNTNLLITTNWMTLTNTPVLTNGLHAVTLPSTNNDLFFRLHKF
jgi:hypothetical protein